MRKEGSIRCKEGPPQNGHRTDPSETDIDGYDVTNPFIMTSLTSVYYNVTNPFIMASLTPLV